MHVEVRPEAQIAVPKEIRVQLEKLLDMCLSGKPSEVAQWAEDMAALKREEQKSFIHYTLQILRQYYMVHLGLPSLARLDAALQEKTQRYAIRMPESFFTHIAEQLSISAERLERHVSSKVLVTSLGFDLFLSMQR